MTQVTDAHPAPHELTKLLSPDEIPTDSRHNLPKHAGLIALGALIWSWVLQAEASQGLQAIEFNKPFFIVCFNHTAPVLLLPFLIGYFWLRGEEIRLDFVGVLGRHSVIPLSKLWRIAVFLSVFYAVTDYFWYAALANVSVAAGTAIFNCSPLFVYCFSICFLHEQPSFGKLCGVFTSFVGVALVVVFQDGNDLDAIASTGTVAGLMVVLSAALYGGYEVAIRLVVGEDITDTTTLLIMTGLSGLFTIPLWIAGSLMLAYSPFEVLYEPLGLPYSPHGLVLMLACGLMAIIFCISLTLSLCWTSPLETSVGCMLTIPLSRIIDTVIHHTSFSWECIAGSAFVMTGFGILEYCSSKDTSLQSDPNKIEHSGALA
ncbi:hypothetical protein F441_11585 [Phytophthora nicotianae CJ01A1]|uniref:EamA domain-containing protein n=5 Tax=Phytophthora nicotianae TaxID=4792 RepID=W2Q2V2_PHYN3|nr:hypothetical protein PPTG_12857 [Phytophthora nicotianae INRA-310]ETI43372.1 hypothetical protein F443_11663 [Phytophthora nicotianae P1569]ETK83442.1 hypothetical protein L915_11345 [Phytophthora nicotianae]ETO72031.1 hypothetical protein F444_11735 [Phytophthora nicotianae P1976]ETP13178.1 hypothetical protein F441_11585 [Phytophthora nicotianae CJ01A1]KUF93019.1 putative vacuolar membrane protein [Phytophthora nicotianae]